MYGNSWLETFRIVDPAVATGVSRRIPGETFEQLMIARCTLVADAGVANRFVACDVFDGDNTAVSRISSTTAVTAGQTAAFTFAVGVGTLIAGGVGEHLLPLPDVPFPPGFDFVISLANAQAGDQLSTIFFYVRRWPTAAWAPSRGAQPYMP